MAQYMQYYIPELQRQGVNHLPHLRLDLPDYDIDEEGGYVSEPPEAPPAQMKRHAKRKGKKPAGAS